MSMKLVPMRPFFDRSYYNSLQGHELVATEGGIFYYITVDGKKAGMVGYIPLSQPGSGLVEVLIAPKFRHRGLVQKAEDELAKLENLNTLYATILLSNIASLGAHRKAGYVDLPMSRINQLRAMGKLREDQTRLVKYY